MANYLRKTERFLPHIYFPKHTIPNALYKICSLIQITRKYMKPTPSFANAYAIIFLTVTYIPVVVKVNLSSIYHINGNVRQRFVPAPILFLLNINELLSKLSNPIHSYAHHSSHSPLQHQVPETTPKQKSNNASGIMHISSFQELRSIPEWASKNFVHFFLLYAFLHISSILHPKNVKT